MPIPSSPDDAGADDRGSPFGGLSAVDAGSEDATGDAFNPESPGDAGFDVFSLFNDLD